MNLTESEGQDTALARLLHSSGALDVPTLQRALLEVRSQRGARGLTLAELLRARGLVERAQLEAALAALAPKPAAPSAPGLPALRDYEVVRELARGGMGAVYEVRRGEARFALKTILSGIGLGDDTSELDRFALEAEVLARLDHPHVVRIHAADLEGPCPYMIQDLLPGGTLEARLSQGPLDPDEAVSLLRKLASGLAQAHAQGVLHRDLKPLNVLFDDRGEPRLVDFGLARLAGQSGLTRTGELLGTPAYMAPEQALGAEVDERTDVYALGGVLFACLTGRPPFQGSGLGILAAVVNDPPPSPRKLAPGVPAWLESVCLRALAKDPAERYPSAAAMAEAMAAEATEARIQPRRRAKRVLLGAIPVALGALLLAGLGAIAWRAWRSGQERARDELIQQVLFSQRGIAALASTLAEQPELPTPAGWTSRGLVAIWRGDEEGARRALSALETLERGREEGAEAGGSTLRQALIGGAALLELEPLEGSPPAAAQRALEGARALARARSRIEAPELLGWEARLRARARELGSLESECGLSAVAGLLAELLAHGQQFMGPAEERALLSALRRTRSAGKERLPRVPDALRPFSDVLKRAPRGGSLDEVARIVRAHRALSDARSAKPQATLAALRAVDMPAYLRAYGSFLAGELVGPAQTAFRRLPLSSLTDLHSAHAGERRSDWLDAFRDTCAWLELLWLLDPEHHLPDAAFRVVRERAVRTIPIPRPPDANFLRGEVSEKLRRDFTGGGDEEWVALQQQQARLVTVCLRRWPDDADLAGRLLRHGATLTDTARLDCVPGVELLLARSEGATAAWLEVFLGFLYARSVGKYPDRREELCEKALAILRPHEASVFAFEPTETLRRWWGTELPDPRFLLCYGFARANGFLFRSAEALSWFERIPPGAVGEGLIPWRVEYLKHRARHVRHLEPGVRDDFAAATARLAFEALRRSSSAAKSDLVSACWEVRVHLSPDEHAELLRRMSDPVRVHLLARVAVSQIEQVPPQREAALASLAGVPEYLEEMRRRFPDNPGLDQPKKVIEETLAGADQLDDRALASRLRWIQHMVQAASWYRPSKALPEKD